MTLHWIKSLFYVDQISIIAIALVFYIGWIVFTFSKNYLRGDGHSRSFFFNLSGLVLSVVLTALSDHIALLLISWLSTSFFLVKLVVHKPNWSAAKATGWVFTSFFAVGFLCIGAGLYGLSTLTGETSLHLIRNSPLIDTRFVLPLLLLLNGALIQTAAFPFHRWLMSSLNAPTPVSALMHAGIINGGGFLLARLAPLYFSFTPLLDLIFLVGAITAIMGTYWKLIQSDIKRTLASSTMAQMGFMLMQCGLGFFTSAIVHLCWHGMYKAYLFLGSGGSVHVKKTQEALKPSSLSFLVALGCGAAGSYVFSYFAHLPWMSQTTSLVLVAIAAMGGTQLALSFLQNKPLKRGLLALLVSCLAGSAYGLGVHLLENYLAPLNLSMPFDLKWHHTLTVGIFALSWLSIFALPYLKERSFFKRLAPALYVKALNASQPDPQTVTTIRKEYHYE